MKRASSPSSEEAAAKRKCDASAVRALANVEEKWRKTHPLNYLEVAALQRRLKEAEKSEHHWRLRVDKNRAEVEDSVEMLLTDTQVDMTTCRACCRFGFADDNHWIKGYSCDVAACGDHRDEFRRCEYCQKCEACVPSDWCASVCNGSLCADCCGHCVGQESSSSAPSDDA